MAKSRLRIFALLFCLALLFQGIPTRAAAQERTLVLGGELFGARMETRGILITSLGGVETANGFCSPAAEAGLKPGDVLLKADGAELKTASDLAKFISKGRPVTLYGERDGAPFQARLVPVQDRNGSYLAGVWIRQGAGGIGTVTFYDPATGRFCGLGHGISDSESGALFPLKSGSVHRVRAERVIRGKAGVPGEIRGSLLPEEEGALLSNEKTGVTGTLTPPEGRTAVPAADKSEVKVGEASIFCTLDDGVRREYAVCIEEIFDRENDPRNLVLRVTDPALLEKSGGIIQGMSGSPILQNGKLVGAVTHVLVSDPTRGYGIFIDNMLDAAGLNGEQDA